VFNPKKKGEIFHYNSPTPLNTAMANWDQSALI
jgi:hypothetical protein